MTINEYFGDWCSIVDLNEVKKVMSRLQALKKPVCPLLKDTFKAFELCPLHKLRVCIIGQDPYNNYINNKPVATGLAFANSSDTHKENYSSSLKVLMDSFIDFEAREDLHNFDPSLKKWEEQGVLLLNTALTCLKDKAGSHTLLWRPFITSLLTNLSRQTTGIVYVLMGSDAISLEPYINEKFNYIIRTKHPAYYARIHTSMPNIWNCINQILIDINGYGINWLNN